MRKSAKDQRQPVNFVQTALKYIPFAYLSCLSERGQPDISKKSAGSTPVLPCAQSCPPSAAALSEIMFFHGLSWPHWLQLQAADGDIKLADPELVYKQSYSS